MQEDLDRVLVRGGVLSPSELKQVVLEGYQRSLSGFHIGSRQDIIFPANKKCIHQESGFDHLVTDRKFMNIVSSYVSSDILPSTSWLTGATYLNILEQFREPVTMSVNITDPRQCLVPLFTGQLNFVAAEEEDYWYLFVHLPSKNDLECFPVLIFTWDLASIVGLTQTVIDDVSDVHELFDEVMGELEANHRTIKKPLTINQQVFPYYEGMNKMGADHYWLGLYWRNNYYNLDFIDDLCNLCLESSIGKVCLTPWKSLIVKGIPKSEKLIWEKLLGSFGINVRHSSLELNWDLPVADTEALELKRFIVREFDQRDISTYGLTFGIRDPGQNKFTSIVIERNKLLDQSSKSQDQSYNIKYAKQFNPDTRRYHVYARDIDQSELPLLLMELSRTYYKQMGEEQKIEIEDPQLLTNTDEVRLEQYQCPSCLNVYDSRFGDALNDVPAGVPFEQLPHSYVCSVCETLKANFVVVQ